MMRVNEEVVGVLLKLFSTDDKTHLQTKLRASDICKT